MLGRILKWTVAAGLIVSFGAVGVVLVVAYLILVSVFDSLASAVDSLKGLIERATNYLKELEYQRERERDLRKRERFERTFKRKGMNDRGWPHHVKTDGQGPDSTTTDTGGFQVEIEVEPDES